MPHDHDHDPGHEHGGHDHGGHEHGGHEHGGPDHGEHDHAGGREKSETELRIERLERVLVAKGLVDPVTLDRIVDAYENRIGPRNGAKVVARAWVDPAYRARLFADATEAIADLGFAGREGYHMVALENTAEVHNVVVCTLCSCYPWPVLGLPPTWYKSAPYRARIVREPRAVLREFGLALSDAVTLRVWDSTAEQRYLVVPERPPGTEDWDEHRLAAIVTRDSMIGTTRLASPT